MKTIIFIILVSFLGLCAQQNTLLNDSIFKDYNIDLNSVVFNKDSIAKYTDLHKLYLFPLRSYLYPNNTGLTDDELFSRFKSYQKAKKNGMKFEEPEIRDPILLEAEFKRVLGKNPYIFLTHGENYYEYEVTDVLLDMYNFYKIGDKIKVFEMNEFMVIPGYETLNSLYGNKLILHMYEKSMYDHDKLTENIVDDIDWFGDEVHIMRDLYATNSYYSIDITKNDRHNILNNYTYEEFKKKCKEIKARMKDKSKPFFWYDYKIDENQEKGE